MKVNVNITGKWRFTDLQRGDCFASGNCPYLKIAEVKCVDALCNAVNLESGAVAYFSQLDPIVALPNAVVTHY